MEHIVGQDRALEVLQTALRSGRLHHAYIFHGPPGVGKFTTAGALARLLLCHEPRSDLVGRLSPCGACEACRLCAAGTHPDLHVVVKELAVFHDSKTVRDRKLMSIPVEVVRDSLLAPANLVAQLRHGKVFIVDEAELLNESGQNAMLKTLEEPPAGTVIILVTSNEDRLLPTVRSRCQRVAFVPLSDGAVVRWLEKHKPELDAQQREQLAVLAGGSIGRARIAADYALWRWAQRIDEALAGIVRRQYPVDLGRDMARLIDEFADAWVKANVNASKDAANRAAAAAMWSLIAQVARRHLADLAQRTASLPAEEQDRQLGPWLAVIDALRAAEADVARNVNLSIVCDHLVAQLFDALQGRRDSDRSLLLLR